MKSRGYNFGAGPATLPLEILKEAQDEFLNWHDKGMSIMEIGHRTPEFVELLDETRSLLREILHIPQNYHVLFLGEPARSQFAIIPMNLLATKQQAGYLVSGVWSGMALAECQKIRQGYCIASSETDGFINIPNQNQWHLEENTRYIYCTTNETINGVRFVNPPKVKNIPLVADMTSSILSEPIDIENFGIIFAGAQKNIAPAGLTIVIIREDLIEQNVDYIIPTMFDYKTHVKNESLYATPPTFNCYMANKMFKWIKNQGGVVKLHENNLLKANKLYEYIDNSDFYYCKVEKSSRSLMNVCFNMFNEEFTQDFLTQSSQRGLLALKGHRVVRGLRASLYNAMPLSGVDALIDFMRDFALSNKL